MGWRRRSRCGLAGEDEEEDASEGRAMTQGGRSAALPKPAPNLKDALRFLVDATNEIIRLESLWAPAGTSHPPISNAEAYVTQAMPIIEAAIPLVA